MTARDSSCPERGIGDHDCAEHGDVWPPAPDPTNPPNDEDIARAFHEAYERLAPDFGYRTREASAKPWAEVPDGNKALMVATVHEVRMALDDPIETSIEAAFGEIEELRRQRDDLETNLAAHKARLHRARTERDELRAQRATALALHAEVRVDSEGYRGCVHCGGDWPCDTRRALGATDVD